MIMNIDARITIIKWAGICVAFWGLESHHSVHDTDAGRGRVDACKGHASMGVGQRAVTVATRNGRASRDGVVLPRVEPWGDRGRRGG